MADRPLSGTSLQAPAAMLGRGVEALRMAWRSAPWVAALWIGCVALTSLLPVAMVRVGKAIVDAVMRREVGWAIGWVLVEMG
ncbi:MAG: hypothetical protein MUF64_32440, partial [Polyangiaceae bacterium]|nr:hypothetical protein [Polyangiaceae bacterium]